MRWVRMLVMLLIAGVIFGGVYGFIMFRNKMIGEFFANMPKPVISVSTAPAATDRWHTTVPAIGTLRAVNGVDVTPYVGGVVQSISFESGQAVKEGDVLVKLDSEIEEANLRAAEANFSLSEANYKRIASLAPGSTVSQANIDERLYQMESQRAQVAALQAQIDKKTVYAPFDGVLGIRQIDLGEYIQPGTAIVNLQNLDTLLVDFSVGQRDLVQVVPGRAIRVTSDAAPGKTFDGKITSLEPRVDPATGLIRVEGSIPNPDGALRPGMFANVAVDLADERDVVIVPSSAISYNLYGDFVYVVEPPADGAEHPTVKRVVVRVGDRRGDQVVIEEGVSASDTVVTAGQLKLSPGMQISVSAEPMPQPDVTAQPY